MLKDTTVIRFRQPDAIDDPRIAPQTQRTYVTCHSKDIKNEGVHERLSRHGHNFSCW